MQWRHNLAIFSDSVFFYVKKWERIEKSEFSVNQSQMVKCLVAPPYVSCQQLDFTLNDG